MYPPPFILVFALVVASKALALAALMSAFVFLLKRQVKLKIFLGFFLTGFLLLLPLNLEQHFRPYPYISTGYLPGFSREIFQEIKKGMDKGEVEKLIGKGFENRFSTFPQEGEKECILYSFDKDFFLVDFAWMGTSVCYNDKNEVTRTVESPVQD